MSNVLELLLSNKNKLKQVTKEFEMKRLSELCGEKVVFKIKALDIDTFNIVFDSNTDNYRCMLLVEGIIEPKMRDLMGVYDCVTPVDVIKKILLPGEVAELTREIEKISGFHDGNLVKEIKN